MTDIRYGTSREPHWHAMVASACVLVVDRNITDDRVRDLWASVGSASSVQPVLDALTRGGISSTPSFALVLLPDGFGTSPAAITMVVRGALEVSVSSPAGSTLISGEGVSTWVERLVPDAIALRIGSPKTKGHADSPVRFFLLNNGSAPVEWLSVGTPLLQESPATSASPVVSESPIAPLRSIPDASSSGDGAVDPGATISDPTVLTAAQEEVGAHESGYDFLFGETVVRTVEGAAVRPEPSEASPVAGDHDGRTSVGLSAAERRAARLARKKPAAPPAPPAPEFALTFSTGERELLDATLIIGRAPSASKVSATSVPRLVIVGGPDQDISRNHVQVSVEGGTVLVTDLHSRNGTMVTLPGRPPQQLRGGQPTAVIDGAIVDLGSGVTMTVGAN
jgi:hypothetical protein